MSFKDCADLAEPLAGTQVSLSDARTMARDPVVKPGGQSVYQPPGTSRAFPPFTRGTGMCIVRVHQNQKGQQSMIGRQWLKLALGSSLLLTGAVVTSGCAEDPGQPSRGSISAPRTGGGAGKAA